MDKILVSVCCITYNQEQYIREAIEGFLMQKTNFKYEVIIRDDASTDATANIIREYEEKYPDIIKPIYEETNKGVNELNFVLKNLFEKAQGKYIALCEGDDFWISEYKLQKQVDYLERNPECSFCFHDADILYMKNMKKERYFNSKRTYKEYISKNGNYDASNIHLFGLGGAPTASFMFRRDNALEFPKWYFNACCGDLPIKLLMTSYGYAHYIDEILSVYRKDTGISITDQWAKEQANNIEKAKKLKNKVIKILDDFDKFTNYKYKKGLDISRKIYEVEIKVIEGKKKEIIKDKNLKKYYKIGFNDPFLIKLFIETYLPQFYKFLRKILKK